jgi:hypothetical protein
MRRSFAPAATKWLRKRSASGGSRYLATETAPHADNSGSFFRFLGPRTAVVLSPPSPREIRRNGKRA